MPSSSKHPEMAKPEGPIVQARSSVNIISELPRQARTALVEHGMMPARLPALFAHDLANLAIQLLPGQHSLAIVSSYCCCVITFACRPCAPWASQPSAD